MDLIWPKFSHSMNATLGREISQDELLADRPCVCHYDGCIKVDSDSGWIVVSPCIATHPLPFAEDPVQFQVDRQTPR